ncbi:MAG: alpha/beta fold hydrolase [Verrucomicrobiota bacterium]
MPFLASTYQAPRSLFSGHVQTLAPVFLRRVPLVTRRRERIVTPDGDFLDLDWSDTDSDRVVVLSHGLEGSSRSSAVQAMARAFVRRGWEVVAWSCRGCSGEPNRLPRAYHSGSSDDLRLIVDHVLEASPFHTLGLVGFSLGGNMTLKYLGEEGGAVDPRIRGGVAFSVPCDLASSSIRLAAWENRIYMKHFLRSLRAKVREKAVRFPGTLDLTGIEQMRSFEEFDDRFTAPLHGFRDARDYWEKASSRPFLSQISIPALLVNARDDPFLTEACFPEKEARESDTFFLELPRSGGHVGFLSWGREYWSERRAVEFLGEFGRRD